MATANIQVREVKEKKKRKLNPDDDNEIHLYKKRKCPPYRENMYPASISLSPTPDAEKRSDACDRSENGLSLGTRPKQNVKKPIAILTRDTSMNDGSLQKLKAAVMKNRDTLKEKMDPTALTEKLHSNKVFDDEAMGNINKCLIRQRKNDALIHEICKLNPKPTNICIFDLFVRLLKETGQEDVILQINSSQALNPLLPDIPQDEHNNLMSFLQQKKEILLDEVEPRLFLDKVGCLTSEEKEEIVRTSKRRDRVKIMFEKIKSSNKNDAAQIAKCMINAYPNLEETFKKQVQYRNTVSVKNEEIAKGARLNFKISLDSAAVQDTHEHDDPMKTLQRKKEIFDDIERRIVTDLDEDPSRLTDMLEDCLLGIDNIKFACVKIYLKALSSKSLNKLLTYTTSGAVKRIIASMIAKDVKELESGTNIVLEISRGCSVKDSIECLCNFDKENISQNSKMIMEATHSKTVIDRFVKSKAMSESNIATLKKVRNINDLHVRKEELLRFLLNEKIPKVFFCILEEEIIRTKRLSVIQSIIKARDIENKTEGTIPLTKSDIMDNRSLLLEELEIQWLTSSLEKREDKDTCVPLSYMKKSVSRESKMDNFINYLLNQNDFSWFAKDLKIYNKHLLDTMLIRKGAINLKNGYGVLDYNRVKLALHFYFDEIVEEIDPLVFAKFLGPISRSALNVQKVNSIPERSKRAEHFCVTLFGVAGSCIIFDVLRAMKICGYEDIVDYISKLAREGPLCSCYRCPNVESLECDEKCVFKAMYSLKDIVDEGLLNIKQQDEKAEDCSSPSLKSKLERYSFREGLVGSVKGSKCGILSGYGLYSEDDESHCEKISCTEKEKWAKEWVKLQSKPDSSGKCIEPSAKGSVTEVQSVDCGSATAKFIDSIRSSLHPFALFTSKIFKEKK